MKTLNLIWSAAFIVTTLFAGVASAKNDRNDNSKPARNGRLKVLGSTGQGRDKHGFDPFHSNYVVLPGDSLPVISLKEYGTCENAKFIASFNHIPESQALRLNQVLNLPSINARGKLFQSHAPVAEGLQQGSATSNSSGFAVTGLPNFPTTDMPNFPTTSGSALPAQFRRTTNAAAMAAPAATSSPALSSAVPRIVMGSTLLVDAAQFGPQAGSAQLNLGDAPTKVEVLEWTATAIKVRLPQLQLAADAKADLLIIRADQTLASKTSIELIAAPSVALAK